MSDFNSLTSALEDWFDKSLSDMPDALRERVKKDFGGLNWDGMNPVARCEVAHQCDKENDTETLQYQQLWQNHFERKKTLESQKTVWETVGVPTASDLEKKEVRLAELETELASIGQREQQARGDYLADDTGGEATTTEKPPQTFLAMKNLTAGEVSISFVGDKAESGLGANSMLEISARGETKRVAIASLDLVDLRRGTLNSQGVILLGMAQKKKLVRSVQNSAKVSRLRKVFSKHMGIKANPFEPYRQGVGWMPHFMITDKRGAADKRAKREGEFRTDSYEQMNEHGAQFAGNDKTDQDLGLENSENELGADWLKNNDPDAPR